MQDEQSKLHKLFKAGVFIKAVDSVVETILGVLFFILSPQTVNGIIFFLLGDELTEQPRDGFWKFILHDWNGLTPDTQSLWAVLFLAHGLLKIILVLGLYKNKIWIYPLAAVVLVAFICYQVYEMFYGPSFALAAITVFDIAFTFLILNEYRMKIKG